MKEKHNRKRGKTMKKLCTSLLAILTLCTMANAPVYANNEETTPETLEIAIPADQWAGTSETFELDNGDLVEITISNVEDVPQPRSTEELGHGTWTRSISYKYTNTSNNKTMRFGWTFKVTCPLEANQYPYFPREPYNIVIENCATVNGPAIIEYTATTARPARIFGTALSSEIVDFARHAELQVTCDYHNMLILAVAVS